MASTVGICNSALIKIGADRIMALTDDSKNARLCNEQFEKLRDEVLRVHQWNFAIARAKLAQLATTPAFGFSYEYQLPADWLRTLSVHADEGGRSSPRFKAEGGKILTDSSVTYLRYVRRITDPNSFDPLFLEALAFRLAAELAMPIAQSNTLKKIMEERYDTSIRKARGTDAQDDFPDEMPEGSWIGGRH